MTMNEKLTERRTGDEGFTLIEMIVTLSILSGVIAMVTGGLMLAFRTLGGNAARLDGTAQSKTAIESMSRTLRTAIMPSQVNGTCTDCDVAAFISGDATSVVFYANVDTDNFIQYSGMNNSVPSKVSYVVDGDGVLTETVRRPDLHAPSGPSAYDYQYTCTPGSTGCEVRQRVLARDLAQDGSPLFTYYDRVGAELPVPLEHEVTRLRAVDGVDILLKVRVTDRVATATTAMRVTLPNAASLHLDDEEETP
jgi:prepilin-type N-terminal cleavage/methylation domain-containing protein